MLLGRYATNKQQEQLCVCPWPSVYRYHIKYMFVGDGVKNEVEKLICNLRPALKLRLRFISHINVDELQEQQR